MAGVLSIPAEAARPGYRDNALDSFLTKEGIGGAATVAAMMAAREGQLIMAGKSPRELLPECGASSSSCGSGRKVSWVLKTEWLPAKPHNQYGRRAATTRETIEVTAGKVTAELRRRGIRSDETVMLTIATCRTQSPHCVSASRGLWRTHCLDVPVADNGVRAWSSRLSDAVGLGAARQSLCPN
jgi:hypothetical protein